MKSLIRGKSYIILSPYIGLPAPVVASAWGVQFKLNNCYDAPRLAQFIAKYRLGSQAPEQDQGCSGGVGTPNEQ